MSFQKLHKFPDPDEVLSLKPLSDGLKAIKQERDGEIKRIVTGELDKFIVIIGPCSAHDEDAVCDYVSRLAKVQEKVGDKLLLIPRIYTNKPRTTGEGYKGMLHQPNPEEEPNMLKGLLAIRNMHLRAMAESGLPAADEMLYPENLPYLDDLLSYIAVGARSAENQQHRLVASGIEVPVGMKNPTSGDYNVMFNSIQAAQNSHVFTFRGYEVKTRSNPLTHAVLRGSVNKHGNSISNYHFEDLLLAIELYLERGLVNPMIIVDTNHDNSKKQHDQQVRIVKEILSNRTWDNSIKQVVKGLMIESFIESGRQNIGDGIYGKSITDPCLGWAQSEELLYYIAERV